VKHDILLAALDNLFEAQAEQKAAETLSPEFCQAMQDAIEAWDGSPPTYLQPVARQLRELAGEFDALPVGAEGIITPPFEARFWKAVKKLREVFLAASEKRPATIVEAKEEEVFVKTVEPIGQLLEERVPHKQICKIYQAPWPKDATDGPGLWNNATNQPMIARLLREIKEPGSVLGEQRDEWPQCESFAQAERLQRQRELAERILAAQDARRERQAAEWSSQQQAGPDETDLAELVAGGVSGTQIARMKQTTLAEIERQCKEESLPVPPRRYSQSREVQNDVAPDIAEARARTEASRFKAFQGRQPQQQAATTAPAPTAEDIGPEDFSPEGFGGNPESGD
jgi:hypothetical protein